MSISRVNAGTWSPGDKLSSTQANGLDLNGTYALDKRTGQTDTLLCDVTVNGTGKIRCAAGGCMPVTAAGAISVTTSQGITTSISGGIYTATASGILSGAADGISTFTAGGISSQVAGGISTSTTSGIKSNTFGGITTSTAGGIATAVAGGFVLAGGATDWPVFGGGSGRSLVRVVGLWPAVQTTMGNSGTLGRSAKANSFGTYHIVKIPTHNGAYLSSVSVAFAPATHSGIPSTKSSMEIWRGGPSGQASLLSAGPTFPSAATVGDYNSLAAILCNCNQNNTIDRTAYEYYAVIQDETGTNAVNNNVYGELTVSFTQIPDMSFP